MDVHPYKLLDMIKTAKTNNLFGNNNNNMHLIIVNLLRGVFQLTLFNLNLFFKVDWEASYINHSCPLIPDEMHLFLNEV